MLGSSNINFFSSCTEILSNKEYACIYPKWVLEVVSPMHTGLSTAAMIQQCHSTGVQEQKSL